MFSNVERGNVITVGVFIDDDGVCSWSEGLHRLKIPALVPTMLLKWGILSMPCNIGTLVLVFDVSESIRLHTLLLPQ